ncbi:MAG TPA: amidohydrolase family protein [Bryobacteraceae bacterium]|nr:amidohydrolase family protein [Bryobacteraceae bacterium]
MHGAILLATALIIRNVTVIDGTGAPPRPRATVAIVNGRIAARAPARARAIDGRGKYLIPGLWDMHAHLRDAKSAADYIAYGITAVRDMGSAGNRPASLRVFTSGPAIEGPGPEVQFPVIRVATGEDGFNAVERLDSQQVDFVKVLSSVPRDAYFAVAQRCRLLRLPFAGHVPNSVTVAEAINARQRSIEHIASIPPDTPPEVLRQMQIYGVRVVPTLAIEPHVADRLQMIRAAGIDILAGSGTADPAALHRELELLVHAGFTPLQAVRAATYAAAEFMGVADRVGSIRRGMDADLVLLGANPLADIRNTRRISAVIVRGVLTRPPKL